MATLSAAPFLIGLTGGIGSGKSTAAGIFRELGAAIVDADAVSRRTTAAGGRAITAIKTQFGDTYIDTNGAMDRAKMRDLVFADASAKKKLEAIVHPLIRQEMLDEIAAASQSSHQNNPKNRKIIVLDLPLLAEKTSFNGWRAQLDAVWVIDCAEATQVARVMRRSGMTESQVLAVMANQATRSQRCRIADVVITNDGCTIFELKAAIIAASHVAMPFAI